MAGLDFTVCVPKAQMGTEGDEMMRLAKTWYIGLLCVGSMVCWAPAAITLSFVQNTITPQAIANDPVLANMQCWSARVSYADGDWSSAGVVIVLPPGNFWYKHPLGSSTKPNPALFPVAPGVQFTTYVAAASDTGSNATTNILGGYPEGDPPSLGDPTSAVPGRLSFSYGDLVPTAPGTYEILRITWPLSVSPSQLGGLMITSQVNPPGSFVVYFPESTALAFLAVPVMLAARRKSVRTRSR